MNTFENLLGETLPSFRSQIVGIKEAERGWRNLYRDRHSISPKNVHRNLCRTSPLHLRTGWGGNSVAQCKENNLCRPDSLTRSGVDVPTIRQNIFIVRVLNDTHRSDSFKYDPLSFGRCSWWTLSESPSLLNRHPQFMSVKENSSGSSQS